MLHQLERCLLASGDRGTTYTWDRCRDYKLHMQDCTVINGWVCRLSRRLAPCCSSWGLVYHIYSIGLLTLLFVVQVSSADKKILAIAQH